VCIIIKEEEREHEFEEEEEEEKVKKIENNIDLDFNTIFRNQYKMYLLFYYV